MKFLVNLGKGDEIEKIHASPASEECNVDGAENVETWGLRQLLREARDILGGVDRRNNVVEARDVPLCQHCFPD